RLPESALTDRDDLLPRLRHDGGGLEEHAEQSERSVGSHGVLGLDAPALRHVAVDLLDASLRVAAVPAHVPLADRAVGARHGIGPAHDADDQIPGAKPAGPRIDDATERFVTEDEASLAFRRPAVLALGDLDVGAADADGDRLDDDRAIPRVR